MKIGQLNQFLNPAMQQKSSKAQSPLDRININTDSYQSNRPELAAKILDDKLAEALGIPKQEEKEKPFFDFDEIVKNVLGFVQGAIKNAQADGKDDDTLRDMFNAARSGVETGIGEAEEILKGGGVYNDEIEEGIGKARDGIFSGIDELEESMFGPQRPAGFEVSAAQFASLSNQAEYQFTTAEGDEVKISFSDVFEAQSGAAYAQNREGAGFAYQLESSREVNFSISVNGELNEEEQEAINALMKDIRDVSDSFFSGDYDKAFELASSLNLGSDQITNFTMDLRQSKTRAAIAQYQQSTPLKELEEALQPLDKRLADINDSAQELGLNNQLPDLLAWINEGQERMSEFLDYAQSFFNTINTDQDKSA